MFNDMDTTIERSRLISKILFLVAIIIIAMQYKDNIQKEFYILSLYDIIIIFLHTFINIRRYTITHHIHTIGIFPNKPAILIVSLLCVLLCSDNVTLQNQDICIYLMMIFITSLANQFEPYQEFFGYE